MRHVLQASECYSCLVSQKRKERLSSLWSVHLGFDKAGRENQLIFLNFLSTIQGNAIQYSTRKYNIRAVLWGKVEETAIRAALHGHTGTVRSQHCPHFAGLQGELFAQAPRRSWGCNLFHQHLWIKEQGSNYCLKFFSLGMFADEMG